MITIKVTFLIQSILTNVYKLRVMALREFEHFANFFGQFANCPGISQIALEFYKLPRYFANCPGILQIAQVFRKLPWHFANRPGISQIALEFCKSPRYFENCPGISQNALGISQNDQTSCKLPWSIDLIRIVPIHIHFISITE